jgi:hypothetical protein
MRRNLEPLLAAHDAALIAKTLAERSLAEVSADELLEEIVKDVFSLADANCKCATCLTLDKAVSKIRERKGTFSLRASGTPDTVTMSTVDFGRMLTQERERAAKIAENCGSLSIAKQIRDPNIRRLAAAPTLSEAALKYCKDCGAKESENQREYDKDCACGGAFSAPEAGAKDGGGK